MGTKSVFIMLGKRRRKCLKEDKKEKHNDKLPSKEECIHCANCGREILKTDNYCMYCGMPMGTKSF